MVERASAAGTMYSEQTNPGFAPRAMGHRRLPPAPPSRPGRAGDPVMSNTTMMPLMGAVIRIETKGGGWFGDAVLRHLDLAAAHWARTRLEGSTCSLPPSARCPGGARERRQVVHRAGRGRGRYCVLR